MSVFFWVITTAYWVIFFPFFVVGCYARSNDRIYQLIKSVKPVAYYGLFVRGYLKVLAVGLALIGGLIYFS